MFTIETPHGTTYQDEVEKVTIPTTSGQITVLPAHIPLITVLQPGAVIVHKEGQMVELAVSSGVAQIKPDSHVVLMADTAERAEDIDVERAEQARKRAEELLAQAADQADVDFAYLQAKIQKELARTHVGNRWRK